MRKLFKFAFVLSLILVGISCNNPKRLAKKELKESSKGEKLEMRFIVSFYSKGSGPDHEAKKQFLEFLMNYQAKNKVKLLYNAAKWGREGEEDFCFPLTELKEKQQLSFIQEVKELLKNSTLVNYQENSQCKK